MNNILKQNSKQYIELNGQDVIAIRLYLEYRKEIIEREINRLGLWQKKDLNPMILRIVGKRNFGLADHKAEIKRLEYLYTRTEVAIKDLVTIDKKNHRLKRVDRIEELIEEFISNSFPILDSPKQSIVPELEITKVEKLRAIEEGFAGIEALKTINEKKGQELEKKLEELQVAYIPESVSPAV